MRKLIFFALFILIVSQIHGQIEVAAMLGKYKVHQPIGFGAFLNAGIPVSDAGYLTGEVGLDLFQDWESGGEYGVLVLPILIGYKHTLNGTGLGFYVQPQAGYNIVGAVSNEYVDEQVHGFAWAGTIGYLFKPGNKIQFDIGLRYESVLHSDGNINFVALRISHSFLLGNRSEY